MKSLVPSTSPSIPQIRIKDLNGFRGQESWGRWTLGKNSDIVINVEQSMQIELDIEFVLPYAKQNLRILLNNESLASLKSNYKNSFFSLYIPLTLKSGDNNISLITDKSNMDSSLIPFAPSDPTDIGVQINRLAFSKLRVLDEKSDGFLYGSIQNAYPLTYKSVLNSKIYLFFQRPGDQLLRYRLLRSMDGQSFDFRIDNQSVYSTGSGLRGTLAVGEIPLHFDKKVHQLNLISIGSAPFSPKSDDAVGSLEKINGFSTFYIQELTFKSSVIWQHWTLPITMVGTVCCVTLLAIWLLRGRTSHTIDG